MISQKIVKLKSDQKLKMGRDELDLPKGTELEIVADVVYMQGFPVPPNMQATLYNWIVDNPTLFRVDQRRF